MWNNRNLWILVSAMLIGETGIWFNMIGNLEFLQGNVESAFLQSVILLSGTFVGLLLGPLAGRVVDRTEKKKVLLAAGFIRLFSVTFMFIALATNSVWWMVVFSIFSGVVNVFFMPALQSMMPLIVPKEHLLAANGAQMNASTVARITGAGLAGVLVTVIGLNGLYMVFAASYAVLLALTFMLKVEEHGLQEKRDAAAAGKRTDGFKEVVPEIKARPNVIMAMVLSFVPFFFLAGFNLNVIKISELLDDASIKGLIYTSEGIGFLLGAALIKRIAQGRDTVRMLLTAGLIVTLTQFALHYSHFYWVPIAAFGVGGLAVGMFFPLCSTLYQTQIPGEYHGRFFSLKAMVDTVAIQVLMLGSGVLLDTVGLENTVVVYGSCGLLILFLLTLRHRRMNGQGGVTPGM